MPIIQDLSKYTTSDYVSKYVSDALSASSGSSYNKYLPTWLFTSSGTWSVPITGTYQVICIGKGGSGGNGGSRTGNDRYKAAAGSGGGAGGIGVCIESFTAGSSIPIEITDSSTAFNTDWVVATAGGSGVSGGEVYHDEDVNYAGGSGGKASGSHLTAAYNGGNGESITNGIFEGSSLGGAGGSVGLILGIPGVNGRAGIGAFPGAFTNGKDGHATYYGSYESKGGSGGMFGAGGSGGGAAAATSGSSGSSTKATATRGLGGQAAVLIQFLDVK